MNNNTNTAAGKQQTDTAGTPTHTLWMRHTQALAALAVFCGGAVGSLTRLGLGSLQSTSAISWPWATTLVNLTGTFMLGLITEWFAQAGKDEGVRKVVRLGLGTGGVGGYTTYSTFIVETDTRFATGGWMLAGGYMVVNIVLGLACAGLGIAAGGALAGLRNEKHSNALSPKPMTTTGNDVPAKPPTTQSATATHSQQFDTASGATHHASHQERPQRGNGEHGNEAEQ